VAAAAGTDVRAERTRDRDHYDQGVQNYLVTTLDNGARIITEPLPSVRSAAIGLWIGTGARDEDDGRAGVTHFLEHLLFKGTRSYSAL
jgi:predicted Zn-dependent peptidase